MAADSKEFAKVAEKMWGMLDTLATSDPEQYKKFVDQQLQEGKEYFSSPEGVYSLKCTNVRYKGNIQTLHINTAKWNRIPYPPTNNDPIPVKGGTLRYLTKPKQTASSSSSIQNNQKELLYDIAFNPRVLTECCSDTSMQQMLINLSIDFTEDTTGIIINRKCVSKENEVCGLPEDIPSSLDDQLNHLLSKDSKIGDTLLERLSKLTTSDREDGKTSADLNGHDLPTLKLPHQQQRKGSHNKPLIEVLNVPPSPPPPSPPPSPSPPEVKITHTDNNGIVIIIHLDKVAHASDIDLDVNEDQLTLTAKRQNDDHHLNYTLDLETYLIDEETIKAQFNKTTAVLTILAVKKKNEKS